MKRSNSRHRKKPHSCRLKSQLEFIALDNQPFSIVQDAGFTTLVEFLEPVMPSLKYFSDQCSSELYSIVYSHVEKLTSGAICISFTTDKCLQALTRLAC